MLLGGAVAGQGAIDIYLLIAIAWFCGLARRHDQLLPRPPARPRVRARARPRFGISRRALRAGRGLLRPPRRQDDLHRPLHQPGARLRAVHRRQLGDALPRLRPLQHPRHRALGQRRTSSIGYFFSRSIDERRPSTPARAPSLLGDADRRRRRRSSSLVRYLRVEENRRAAVRWMEGHAATRWIVALGAASAAAPLPLGPGHAGRHLRARVHLADGDPRRRALRPRRLHGDRRRRPGADPGRRDRDRTSSNDLQTGWLDRRRQGGHRARLRRRRSCRWRVDLRAALLAWRRRWAESAVLVAGDGDHRSSASHELKDAVDRPRPAGPAGRRLRLLLPQRPRRLLDLLRLAGGDDRRCGCGRGWRAARRWSPPASCSPR